MLFFLKDQEFKWWQGSYAELPGDSWTKLQLDVPADAKLPLQRVGVQFITTNDATWTGSVHIDSVLRALE